MQNLFTPRIAQSRLQMMKMLASFENLRKGFHDADRDAAMETDRKVLRPFRNHKMHELLWRNIKKLPIVAKNSSVISKESPLGF